LSTVLTEQEFAAEIRRFLEEALGVEASQLGADVNLATEVALDSLQMIALLRHVEELRQEPFDEVPEFDALTSHALYFQMYLSRPSALNASRPSDPSSLEGDSMKRSSRTVLLTGVTGFIGGAIAIELLTTTDVEILCLVREADGMPGNARLEAALRASAEMYGIEIDDDQLRRCHPLVGDITEPFAGVQAEAIPPLASVWHVAASLAFEDERADEISRHNFEGTKNVVDLAAAAGCGEFNYVSTAYVAGDRRGVIAEENIPAGAEMTANNHYERTKMQAERVVAGAGFDVTRIFRPSIVIGHSWTLQATTFSGLYGFVRNLQRARELVRQSLGDLLKYRPLRLLADGDTPVNFVPVDYVASAAVRISESGAEGVFHLANSTPPRLADCWIGIADVLGMVQPLFVTNTDEFTLIDQKVDDKMAFYRSYVADEKYFSTSRVEKILGNDAMACALPPESIFRYVDWYLTHCSKSRRPAAAEVR
jgi:nucleoside-diphosphate-sugar epimerase